MSNPSRGIVNAVTGKMVDPTILSALSASLTVQYGVTIAPETVTRYQLDHPLYDRLVAVSQLMMGHPVVRPDKAAVFSVLTAADFTGSGAGAAFAVGDDPHSINPQRSMHAITKKSYGASGGVKDVDIIASSMPGAPISINADQFADDAEMLLTLLYERTLQGIDYDMVKGNSGSDPNAFDGLEYKVVSGTSGFYTDQVGASLTAGLINQHIAWMMAGGSGGKGGGPRPTAIYCHPVIHLGIVNAYEDRTKASINIVDGKENALGLWATRIITPAGELPIISDPRFTISSDGTSVTGDVFFAVEHHNGVPILYPDWQVMPTAIPLGKVMGRGRATSTELAVWSHLAVVERTNWWAQGRMANVKVSFAPAVTSVSE
jgi:hypothetical protein